MVVEILNALHSLAALQRAVGAQISAPFGMMSHQVLVGDLFSIEAALAVAFQTLANAFKIIEETHYISWRLLERIPLTTHGTLLEFGYAQGAIEVVLAGGTLLWVVDEGHADGAFE